MTNEERRAALEAIIYAADEPATIEQLAKALGEEKLVVQASLDELVAGYAAEERGIEIRAVAGGYKMYTKPQHHDVVRRFIKSLRPPLRLSMPALETLASLKEFEALAREALGSDEGFAPAGEVASDEWRVASESKPGAKADEATENTASAEMEAREELLGETAASNEGMPEGDSEESRKTAGAGE